MTTLTYRDKKTAREIAVKWLTTSVQGRDMRRTLTDAIATVLADERARIISDLAGAGFNDAADYLNGDKQ